MSVSNPLRQVYTALWDMLEANQNLTALVEVGNRLKFTGTGSLAIQQDQVLGPADFPELKVVCVGSLAHLQRTSNGSSLDTRWEIHVASGDQRFQTLFDVEWEVYRALIDWETYIRPLTWNSKTFAYICRPMDTDTSLLNQQANRGTTGWSAVWAGEIHMMFASADLVVS